MPHAMLSVDRREDGRFESNAHRAFPLLDAFTACRWDVGLLNINLALDRVEERARNGVVFVLADTFAAGSEGAGRFPDGHGFRDWLTVRRLRYVGSPGAAIRGSSTGDKIAARGTLAAAGLTVPAGTAVRRGAPVDSAAVMATLGRPVVVKQATGTGVGVGVHLARDPAQLDELLQWHQRVRGRDVVVERFIAGREFSAWVIDRDGEPRCYGLVEIGKPPGTPILDQGAKLRSRLVPAFSAEPRNPEVLPCPPLGEPLRAVLATTVVAAHRALGLRHYSRTDLLVAEDAAHVLDVNATPELAEPGLGAVAECRGETFAGVITTLAREALR